MTPSGSKFRSFYHSTKNVIWRLLHHTSSNSTSTGNVVGGHSSDAFKDLTSEAQGHPTAAPHSQPPPPPPPPLSDDNHVPLQGPLPGWTATGVRDGYPVRSRLPSTGIYVNAPIRTLRTFTCRYLVKTEKSGMSWKLPF